jgi:hypothetical protein
MLIGSSCHGVSVARVGSDGGPELTLEGVLQSRRVLDFLKLDCRIQTEH